MSKVLPKVDIYMSLLQKGGQDAKYVATSKNSKMKGRVLKQGSGVTFDCLNSRMETKPNGREEKHPTTVVKYEPKPNVEPHRLEAGTPVNVKYGKLNFKAKIVKFTGFETYEVIYESNGRKEVGVIRERITVRWHEEVEVFRFNDNPKLNGWPFVAVPLRKGQTVVGFIGTDDFDNCSKGREDELQPEDGADGGVLHYIRER